jgi:riboflavin synthase
MVIQATSLVSKIRRGDSLAVNGACLSLLAVDNDNLHFNLAKETISRTNLGGLRPGESLNLELPLTLSAPLSGHLVTGHVDAVGKVLRITERRPGKRLTVSFPRAIRPYLVPKGSVAVNGVSLTIADLKVSAMEIELIPLTLEGTNLDALRPGSTVNIECDIIGKYVYNWLAQGRKAGR